LDQLGVLNAWSNDPAGLQLLQLLGQWRDELHQDDTRCSFSECKRWLSQQLDLNTFRDISIESPVLFTHLAATRWRCFDAVVLLGCDTQHLPAPSNNFWFNDSVRTALGLPSSSVVREAVRDDLLGLLAINDDILVTWPARKNGELNLLSPYFELIRVLHVMSYGDNLAADELGRILDRADVQKITTVLPDVSVMPEPVIMPNLLPQRISPSGYNSLVACPYQYFSRYVLRLNELDEVREVIDKRDYGTWIHAVLHRFHNTYSLLLNEDRTRMESELHRISIDVFSDGLQQDYLTQAWMQAWQALIPIYVEWQLQREKSGWRYLVGEEQFEVAITQDLTLYGRIDRVDQHMDPLNSVCVLDYKTQSESGLKRKLIDPGEDVQLPCYVYARGGQHAVFVSLAENDVQEVEPKYDVTELVRLNTDRLVTLFSQLRHGAALPANGVQAVCDYCEMRGLCRQGGWELDSIPHSLSHLDSVGGQLKALGNPEQGPLGEAMRDEDNHE
jgi:ATP-dependent helicase/nuclease subunit B